MKIVMVEWIDSCTHKDGRWIDKCNIKDLETAGGCSVGVMVKENNKQITIAQSMGDYEASGLMSIPKGCIKKITQLYVNTYCHPKQDCPFVLIKCVMEKPDCAMCRYYSGNTNSSTWKMKE
jgi:hypothetical protein